MNIKQAISQLDNPETWNSHEQELECVMVLQDTHNVKTFCFQTANATYFRYTPGQFITLDLEINGERVKRSYTLSSTPSRPHCICITVKASEDGCVSRWLHDNLQVGDNIKAVGPAGLFTLDNHLADKYLFLAGGVGITPMLSMVRWLYDYGRHTDVVLVQCAHTPSDLIARRELETMSARLPDIKLAWVCKQADKHGAWTGYTGRLNQLMLELIAPDYMEREIFCCGPEEYMHAVRDMLHIAEFNMEHYHEESFAKPVAQASEQIEHDDTIINEAKEATVVFTDSDKTVQCHENNTIIEAAEEAGIYIPSACLFGVCGACMVKKVSGEVHMLHNGGIAESDIDDGFILACCSNPLGKVEIDF